MCNGLSIISNSELIKQDDSRVSKAIKKWMTRPKTPDNKLPTPRHSLDLESHPSCGSIKIMVLIYEYDPIAQLVRARCLYTTRYT